MHTVYKLHANLRRTQQQSQDVTATMSKFACMLHGLSHAPLPELAVRQFTVYIPFHARLTVHHLLLYVIRPDGLTHITSLENEPCEIA